MNEKESNDRPLPIAIRNTSCRADTTTAISQSLSHFSQLVVSKLRGDGIEPRETRPSSHGILYSSKQCFGIGVSEVARSTIPVQRGRQIALYPPNMRASKEGGVECTAKPQCRRSIPRRRCVLIKSRAEVRSPVANNASPRANRASASAF